MKYEILEHKADLKIRAFGLTKEEVFSNMLFAMAENQKPEFSDGEEVGRKIKIKSMDLESLLVYFLSEALYLSQANREAYFKFNFENFTDREIEGELIGKKIKRFGEDIKAVTFHDLAIREKEDGTWEATVLFDI